MLGSNKDIKNGQQPRDLHADLREGLNESLNQELKRELPVPLSTNESDTVYRSAEMTPWYRRHIISIVHCGRAKGVFRKCIRGCVD